MQDYEVKDTIYEEKDKNNFSEFMVVVSSIYAELHDLEEDETNEMLWFNRNIIKHIPREYILFQKVEADDKDADLVEILNELYEESNHQNLKFELLKAIKMKLDQLKKNYDDLGKETIDANDTNVFNDLIKSQLLTIYKKLSKACNIPITSLKELFSTTGLDLVDCSDDTEIEYSYNYEEEYYGCIELSKNQLDIYSNFNITCITNHIEKFFKNEKVYKLGRFINIKKDVIDKLKDYFDKLVENNIRKIKKNIKREIMTDFMNECLTYTYHDKLYKLYKLFVLNPLLTMDISYKDDDYIEPLEHKEKRKSIADMIKKTQMQYDLIELIK